MEIVLNKFNKQSQIYLSIAFILASVACGLLIIKFKPFTFLFNNFSNISTENYKPFVAKGELAKAIEYLPIDRNLAEEKLSQMSMGGVSNEENARRLYILAQIEHRSGKLEEALKYYSQINLRAIPFLADRVLLHKAEIAGELGQEKLVIEFCHNILRYYPKSLSIPSAHYEMARSFLRQGQEEIAKNEFEKTRTSYNGSQQAIGSLYYLGQLAENKKDRNLFWENYLIYSPNGRFVSEILNIWLLNLDSLTPKQKSLIGLIYYKNDDKEQALKFLNSEINEYTWLALSELLYKTNQKVLAQQTLVNALMQFPNSENYLEGINMFLRNVAKAERDNLFAQILNKAIISEKPYLLWKLANASSKERKQELFLQIEKQYPSSIWAGRAGAEIFWNAYKDGQIENAKILGSNLLINYNNSSSMGKVRFWLAKRAESEGNIQKAKELYNQILLIHPSNYYAFRARGRLQALNGGQDMGWFIGRGNFANNSFQNWVFPLPKEELTQLNPTLQELFSLNLWQEALMLMPQNYAKQYPALYAWLLARVEDKTAEAIKTASDELYKKNSNFENNHDYWLIAYPFLYSPFIFNSAQKYSFDPLLMLSLIRQESRFQPKVISSAKAIGLCQLMPATAKEVSRSLGQAAPDANALYDPAYNIELGSKYLTGLLKQFNGQGHLAIAAYNAGPGSVSKWLKNSTNTDPDWFIETIPFQETQKYVISVFENYWVYSNLMQKVYTENKFTYSQPNKPSLE